MRHFELRVECPCAAEEFWKLREDPQWDAVSGAEDGQVFVPVETIRAPSPHGPRMRRVSLLVQPWPTALMRIIRPHEDLTVQVTTSWYVARHDEAYPCHINIHVPIFGDRFAINGLLWVEPTCDHKCTLRTSYTIDVRAPVLTHQIENIIEQKMRTAYEDQPRRVMAYLRSRNTSECIAARPVAVASAGAIPVASVEIEPQPS